MSELKRVPDERHARIAARAARSQRSRATERLGVGVVMTLR